MEVTNWIQNLDKLISSLSSTLLLCACGLSYLTLCNPMDCSPPGSSVHGILQARILEWVAISFSRDLPDPGIKPSSLTSPALVGGSFLKQTKNYLFFNWRIIALQNFVIFCQISTWISHRYIYIPTRLNLPPISLPIPPLWVDIEPLFEFPETYSHG